MYHGISSPIIPAGSEPSSHACMGILRLPRGSDSRTLGDVKFVTPLLAAGMTFHRNGGMFCVFHFGTADSYRFGFLFRKGKCKFCTVCVIQCLNCAAVCGNDCLTDRQPDSDATVAVGGVSVIFSVKYDRKL